DDALRAIRLFTAQIADAVVEGRSLATEKDFGAAAIVSEEEAAAEHTPEEFTQYLDPKYAEQLMSESLATANEPEPPPRKGPASEAPEEVASTTVGEH
ncbi:MAG: 30S ribosomal protein S2, partial [Bryobacteraceae bacterium]